MQQSASMSRDIPTILGYVDAHLDGVYSEDVQKHEPFQAHAATAIVCDACRYDNHATQNHTSRIQVFLRGFHAAPHRSLGNVLLALDRYDCFSNKVAAVKATAATCPH